MSSNKQKDVTAMKHARTWVADRHPGALLVEASKRIMWIPDGKGGRLPRTKAEDIWGVFDLVSFPIMPGGLVDLIQVTTITDGSMSAVNTRLAKVGTWVRDNLDRNQIPTWLEDIYIIGWVARKHFRVWRWSWRVTGAVTWGGWDELDPQKVSAEKSRSTKQERSDPATSVPEPAPSTGNPFS